MRHLGRRPLLLRSLSSRMNNLWRGFCAVNPDRVRSATTQARAGEPMISFARILRTAALVASALALVPAAALSDAGPKTLRFIPQADLRSIDPIWTTAYVTRNFGYLVFDTLFSLDKDFKPQPQMVDRWTVSDDRLVYKFTLRDGLKWHDGQPVRAADCVASLERWGKRDPFGQKLMQATAAIAANDDQSFTITLKAPFPLLLDAIGKLS